MLDGNKCHREKSSRKGVGHTCQGERESPQRADISLTLTESLLTHSGYYLSLCKKKQYFQKGGPGSSPVA